MSKSDPRSYQVSATDDDTGVEVSGTVYVPDEDSALNLARSGFRDESSEDGGWTVTVTEADDDAEND